uniref:IncF plasmid conjugative transfer protein TraN n=1 Tax=Klebsiella pneumoniae TaxID=573 RepID=A0A8B0STM0_KLEPN|nr:IncF plasmid conjugative transfer protein TraN [Klebsiella pneumoniae]
MVVALLHVTSVYQFTSLVVMVTLSVCGDNCIRIWFGKRGNDYWSGGVYDNSMTLHFHRDAILKSASIVNAEWDDHMQVNLDGKQIFLLISMVNIANSVMAHHVMAWREINRIN